ncbi:hypothetical protein [Mucilaginibacter ginsenosidivorax]|uniref:PH domain-containing protein n=1 Tax=Mucilaginibacter ginsenosidivorax TaxID=862126 RepID=A0A5B8VY82_9SPHI|nr:hypothetical protein [Mucilaginibacter ginsenosidivorax]QEC76364.1 hypothetical protein FSB76_10550 [Mucilaginibacter ginsenosidivorax]
MDTEKRYTFNPRRLIFESVFTLALVGFAVWFTIKAVLLFPATGPLLLFLLFFFTGLISILYQQIKTWLVLRQYYQFDKDKTIILSADRLTLNMGKDNLDIHINSDEVVTVEIYEGKPWGRFQNFDYIILYTIDNQKVIITQFTVPLLVHDKVFKKFLRRKPRKYFKKRFNFIDVN